MTAIPPELAGWIDLDPGPALLVTARNLDLAASLREAGPGVDWTVLTKEDRRGWGAGRLVRFLRSRAWRLLVIDVEPDELRRRRDLYTLLALLGRGRVRVLLSEEETGIRMFRIHPVSAGLRLLGSLIGEAVSTTRALIAARNLDRRLAARPGPAFPGLPAGSRIAVLRTSFWFGLKAGGSVSHARGVLRGMEELGFEPRLWTVSRIPARLPPGAQIEVPPPGRPALIEEAAVAAYNRTFVQHALEDIAQFDPAVIYHRHDAFSLVGLDVARRLGVPLVLEVNASEVWAREAWSKLHFRDLARSMERTAFRRADRLVLISEELVPQVLELGGTRDRIVVSPNGVEVERFDPTDRGADFRRERGLPGNAVLCGFLGTFTRWHGVLFLAEEAIRLAGQDPHLHFLFIGDGDLRSEVARRIEAAGISGRAQFTGLVAPETVPRMLGACDILLSPHLPFEDGSVFFGSPTKLFEYMAAGRAIVASRLGQIGTVIDDEESGLLYSPGDGEAFRSAVLRLAGDAGLRQRLGDRARRVAMDRYTWKANVRRALEGVVPLPDETP